MGKDQGQPGGRREGEGRAWPRASLRFSWEGMCQAEQVHWIDLEWDGLNDFGRLWAIYSFPGSTVIKNFPANAREGSLTLGLGRSPGVGNDNPLHYSCLENSIDRGASVQFSSVSQSCLTLCNPWTAACQASLSINKSQSLLQLMSQWYHPTISSLVVPFSSPFNLSQHQGLIKWVSSSHQVAKVLEFQLQHQSFQWIFRTDFL